MIRKRLIQLLGHAEKYVALQVLLQILSLLCQVVIVFEMSALLSDLFMDGLQAYSLMHYLVPAGIALLVRFLAQRGYSSASYKASVDVKRILRDQIYEKMLRLGASYREKIPSSQVVQMAGEGVDQLEIYFGKYLSQFFFALTAPVILFLILWNADWKAGLVLLVCVPLIPVVIMIVMKAARKLLDKYFNIYYGLGDSFLENLQGLTTLKIYQADEEKAEEMDKHSELFRKVTMKVLSMQLNSTIIMDIVAYGGAALGIITVLSDFQAGDVSFAAALRVILLSFEFFRPMRTLGSCFHIGMNGMKASDRIFAFLDLEEPEKKEGKIEGSVSIQLDHIHFTYPDADQETLHDVSLSIPAGSFTSIVGASGSGKSTIAGLLTGRNRDYTGHVTVNGQELSDISEESLMKNITLVSHDSWLFRGTVRDNLRMGNPEASGEELEEALRKVRLLDFMEERGGLDYELEENAANLSGGQKQRLALARALLHNSPVYIFDEATSNIDMESEEAIMEVIHAMAHEKTVILISHRLANVVHSDQTAVMEQGKCVEQGKHDDLLKQNGKYAELYRTQTSLEHYGSSLHRKQNIIQVHNERPQVQEKKEVHETKRQSGWAVMGRLIVLVKPLLPVMILAVVFGTAGHMCASLLGAAGGYGVLKSLPVNAVTSEELVFGNHIPYLSSVSLSRLSFLLILMAVMRGILHYGEQYCNHYIAFRLLALIRHKVFAALRKLCPAKLEGKDAGNLITVITSDIELLEVFYAHTISPIAIGILTTILMLVFLGKQNPASLLPALAGYVLIGAVLPVISGHHSRQSGRQYRTGLADMNSYVLDSLYGIEETIQYGQGKAGRKEMDRRSRHLGDLQKQMNRYERDASSLMNLLIELFSWIVLLINLGSYLHGTISYANALICTLAYVSSFGPVSALSALGNTLNQTLACGDRVLSLLEEKPQVEENTSGTEIKNFTGADMEHVTFGYDGFPVWKDLSVSFERNHVIGIHGPSGCGKSTMLKLLMRFWDPQSGTIRISEKDLKSIQTSSLRNTEACVSQDTWLFHDTIAENISLGRTDVTREEIISAARKAGIHDFIMTLEKGYDTMIGEKGDTLSGGERQRIGLSRAFVHQAPFLLLDEPTSNLDSLNEGIILKALEEGRKGETVVIVSHRLSTLASADTVVEVK